MSEALVEVGMTVIKVFVAIYEFVTYVPFTLIYQPLQKLHLWHMTKSYCIGDSSWRHREFTARFKGPLENAKTLGELFTGSVVRHGHLPSLGTRELLSEEDEVQPNGKVFKKVTMGDYHFLSYEEVNNHVIDFGKGVLSKLSYKGGEKVALFAETRKEWFMAAQSCFQFNLILVTIYSNLGDDGVIHGINESEAGTIFTSNELLPKVIKMLPNLMNVKNIVVLNTSIEEVPVAKAPSGIKIYTFHELAAFGAGIKSIKFIPPIIDDTAIIMYTSGSTGVPKGVMISHRNMLTTLGGVTYDLKQQGLGPGDSYIAYLPLAHVLELAAEIALFSMGVRMGYSSPTTLYDKASKIKHGTKGDCAALLPTLMICVPVIMDRIKKAVETQLEEGPLFLKRLFQYVLALKLRRMQDGFVTPIFTYLFFRKVRKLLGGKVKFMLSGGAPLSGETQTFMQICFCCPVLQGYGLTETCGGGTMLTVGDNTVDTCGGPIPSAEIKLREWAEGNCFPDSKPPRGEILIGGSLVAQGYWKNEEKTKESFITLPDSGLRWFATGDIGEVTEEGTFKIIDRKKDLVKTMTGEYISLGKVESALNKSLLVEQVCVYVDPRMETSVCIIVVKPSSLSKFSESLQITCSEDDLFTEPQVVAKVLKDLQALCLKNGLQRFEIPSAVTLAKEPWTPENGLLTASMKLKRRDLSLFFEAEIRKMYSSKK